MRKLSKNQKQFLWDATSLYKKSLPDSPAARFLESRGLTEKDVSPFGLGFVADPLPGHERYRGMLSIPYLRRSAKEWMTIAIRFRCVQPDCDHTSHPGGKYVSMPGDPPHIYNATALIEHEQTIAICEGELDALTATVCGVPAVGIAGAELWQDHFTPLFSGYQDVYVLSDGDAAGEKLAETIAKKLPNAKVIPSSPGGDVSSDVLAYGRDYLVKRIQNVTRDDS